MSGMKDFEIAYMMGELKWLIVRADRLSRSDAYAEICFAERLLLGHKPSDPAVTFEVLARSVGIELVHVHAMSSGGPRPVCQTSPLSGKTLLRLAKLMQPWIERR